MMSRIILKDEAFTLVGKCFEVHKTLGPGFLEIVYKDALELEFQQARISYNREKEFTVFYKGDQLRHRFYADFTAFGKIIIEVKAVDGFHEVHFAQCINYLRVSGYRLALLFNFGQTNLQYRRFVL